MKLVSPVDRVPYLGQMVAKLLASGLAMALFAGDSAPLAGIANSRDGNYPLAPAQELVSRDGLPNFFAKLDRGEPVTIAYFGTSLTAAPGWRVMTFDWLKQRYPRSKLTMVSASLGGTGSIAGAFRADRDLLPSRPDLVFVEFAGNDNADARSQPMDVLRAMEGIVRKIRRASPATEICLIYAFGFGDFKTQKPIVDDLRAVGMSVAVTHRLGNGYPDINIGWHGLDQLVELKSSERDTLTPDEVKFHAEWRGYPILIAWTSEQVIEHMKKRVRLSAYEQKVSTKEARHP